MYKLLYVGLSFALLALLPVAAVRWGGRPERRAAFAYLAAATASILVRAPASVRYVKPDLALAIVDLALLAFLLIATLETDRRWLVFATAFQAISTLAHLGPIVAPSFNRYGYNLMETFSTMPALLALAIGIWAHARRSKMR